MGVLLKMSALKNQVRFRAVNCFVNGADHAHRLDSLISNM